VDPSKTDELKDPAPITEIITAAPGLLAVVDGDGRLRAVSRDLAQFVGVPAGEMIGRAWMSFLGTTLSASAGDGSSPELAVLQRHDGATRWVEWRGTPVGGGGRLIAVRDVTAQRRLEDADARLLEAERLAVVGSLAGGVAHQINNALTATRLSLGRLISFELARQPMTAIRQHRLELLQDAREGLARVEHITRELKSFARLDDAPAAPLDVRGAIEAAVALAAHEIRHRARLVTDLADVPQVFGTDHGLRQVFLNLLLNAAQSLPEGEADHNEVRVASWTDAAGNAVVEVCDTGTGIAGPDLGRIFEPFFTTRPLGAGLGLGLSVCHDVVTAMRGTITAESAVGQGTRMRVVLPPAARPAVRVPTPMPVAAMRDDEGKRRILIVDDDRPVAAAVALELEDHDVVVAGSGREAFEILRHDPGFDVVLCDLMMPEMSGMDLYTWLRPIEPSLVERFVFMSGGAFTPRAERFLAETTNPRLDKPFPPDELRRVIGGVIRDRGRREPVRSTRTTLDGSFRVRKITPPA
jgi:two-component system, cell cycle sensor histidine kinase and response regulator CckA